MLQLPLADLHEPEGTVPAAEGYLAEKSKQMAMMCRRDKVRTLSVIGRRKPLPPPVPEKKGQQLLVAGCPL